MNNLYDEIKDTYNKKNYIKTIGLINEYLNDNKNGVFYELVYIYIKTLIHLGNIKQASKNLDIFYDLYKDKCDQKDLMKLYIKCDRVEDAKKIIENYDLSPQDYFSLGKFYYTNEYYNEAKEYFEKYLKVGDNEKNKLIIKEFLYKLENKDKKNVFLEQNYEHFKINNTLGPRYIIYARSELDKANNNYSNSIKPYLVWKIENNIVYAFSITNKIKDNKDYILKKEIYCSNEDKKVKEVLVKLDLKDIEKVTEYIREEDFNQIIKNIYNKILVDSNIDMKDKSIFLTEYMKNMNIQEEDVIEYYDRVNRKKEAYYIKKINEKKQKYELLKIDISDIDNIKIDNKIIEKKINKYIYKVIKLTDEEKEKIKKKLIKPTKSIVPGTIIQKDNNELLVMEIIKDKLICINKTNSFSNIYIDIIDIDKKDKFEIIREETKDELKKEYKLYKEYNDNKKNNLIRGRKTRY